MVYSFFFTSSSSSSVYYCIVFGGVSFISYSLCVLIAREKGTRPSALFDQQLRQAENPSAVPLQEGPWTQCYGQPEAQSNTEYRGTKIVGLTLHRLIERITHPESPDVRYEGEMEESFSFRLLFFGVCFGFREEFS
jgi:hypothetical protein